VRSDGTISAYDGTGPQFISSSKAGNAAQITRGFKTDQINTSGNVDFYLSSTSSVSVRGGMFSDTYADTGVSTTTAVIWNTPSIGVAGVPANLQLPKGNQNTPRVLITNKEMPDAVAYTITKTLLENKLVDEYHFWFFPVVAEGDTMFRGTGIDITHLELLGTTTFKSGIVVHKLGPKA